MRVCSAFSLRANLARLVRQPEGRLGSIDGLRALAILWTVAFHAAWYSGYNVPPATYFRLLRDPALLPLWRGHAGVDLFFVLSGFLIASMLLDERDRTGTIRVGLFYVRRLLRLWPALAAAAVLYAIVVGGNNETLWANLLYVSNFLPVLHSAMTWTWSLAIEEQFYLLAPWGILLLAPLTPRARIAWLVAIAGVFVAIGAWVIAAGGFGLHDSEVALDREIGDWARAFDALYTKPWMRIGPLLAGVAAAGIRRTPGTIAALGRHPGFASAGALAAIAVAILSIEWPLLLGAPRAIEIAYLAIARTAFGAACAYLVLFTLVRRGPGRALGAALSAAWLRPIAHLAYAAYLVNPTMTLLVDHTIADDVIAADIPVLAVLLPCNMIATFAVALVLHLAIERPLMELRPDPRSP